MAQPVFYDYNNKHYTVDSLRSNADKDWNEFKSALVDGDKNSQALDEAYDTIMNGLYDGTITVKNGNLYTTNNEIAGDDPMRGAAVYYIKRLLGKGDEYQTPEEKKKKELNQQTMAQGLTNYIFNGNTFDPTQFLELDAYDENTKKRGLTNRIKWFNDYLDNIDFDRDFKDFSEDDKAKYQGMIDQVRLALSDGQITENEYLTLSRLFGNLDWKSLFTTDKEYQTLTPEQESPTEGTTPTAATPEDQFDTWISGQIPAWDGQATEHYVNTDTFESPDTKAFLNGYMSRLNADNSLKYFNYLETLGDDDNVDYNNQLFVPVVNLMKQLLLNGNIDGNFKKPTAKQLRGAVLNNLIRDGVFKQISTGRYMMHPKDQAWAYVYDTKTKKLYKQGLRDIPEYYQLKKAEYQNNNGKWWAKYETATEKKLDTEVQSQKNGGVLKAQFGLLMPTNPLDKPDYTESFPSLTLDDPSYGQVIFGDVKAYNPNNYIPEWMDGWYSIDENGNYSDKLLDLTGPGVGLGRNKGFLNLTQDEGKRREQFAKYKQYTEELIKLAKLYDDAIARGEDYTVDPNSELARYMKAYDKQKGVVGTLASFYGDNGKIRKSWTTTNNDSFGRAGATLDTVANRIEALRNDNMWGRAHMNGRRLTKRYQYYDRKTGKLYWIDPKQALDKSLFRIVGDPRRVDNGGMDMFDDYTLVTPEEYEEMNNGKKDDKDETKLNGNANFKDIAQPNPFNNALAEILRLLRLKQSLDTNKRNALLLHNANQLQLHDTYREQSPITGAYTQNALAHNIACTYNSSSADMMSSDGRLRLAASLSAVDKGQDVLEKALLNDIQERQRTGAISQLLESQNKARRQQVADKNIDTIGQWRQRDAEIDSTRNMMDYTSKDNYLALRESDATTENNKNKELYDTYVQSVLTNIANGQNAEKLRLLQLDFYKWYDSLDDAKRNNASWLRALPIYQQYQRDVAELQRNAQILASRWYIQSKGWPDYNPESVFKYSDKYRNGGKLICKNRFMR